MGIPLVATTDTLQLITSAAVTVDVLAGFADGVVAGGDITTVDVNKQVSAITTATTTTVVAAPTANVRRNVDTLHIRNKHASLSVDVTVVLDVSGTDYELFKASLRAGETLEYLEGVGFFVTASAVGVYDEIRRVAADRINATTSFADISDLTFAGIEAGKHYLLLSHLFHVENAATTGPRFGIAGVAMTGMRLGTIDTVTHTSVDAAVMRGGALATAVDTSPAGVTLTGNAAITLAILSGWFNPSASGTVAVRFQSEIAVAAGVTVKQGSWAIVREMA